MRTCTSDLDRLDNEIAELSAHLDAATARLLDLIREFDAREGWNNGFRSCAAWLSWRVGLSPCSAREHVRVARALGSLPLLAQALARGELSYAKVRALTGSTPEPRPSATRSSSTSMPRFLQTPMRTASRSSRAARAFPRERPSAWRATRVEC